MYFHVKLWGVVSGGHRATAPRTPPSRLLQGGGCCLEETFYNPPVLKPNARGVLSF